VKDSVGAGEIGGLSGSGRIQRATVCTYGEGIAGDDGDDARSLPAAERDLQGTRAKKAMAAADGQLISKALLEVVTPLEVSGGVVPVELGEEEEAAIITVLIIEGLAPGVGRGEREAFREAAGELSLKGLVVGGEAGEDEIGGSGPTEKLIERLRGDATAKGAGVVDVLVYGHMDAVVGDIGELEGEITRKRLLDGDVPGFDIGVVEGLRDDVVLLAVELRRGAGDGDDAVGRDSDGDRGREAALEGGGGAVAEQSGTVCGADLIAIVGADGVVVGVGVVGEWGVADAKATADDGVVSGTEGEAGARREVVVVRLEAEIGRIAADTGDDEGVGGLVVVGEAAVLARGGGWVELPADAEIDGEARGDLPFIAGEGEDPPLAIGREVRGEIAAGEVGEIEKEAGHVIGDVGVGAYSFAACVGKGCRLIFAEGVSATRTVGLTLKEIVADPAEIATELDGVIADGLGPVIDEIDVGFGANPRH